MTDATYSRGLAQVNSLRIRQSSLLTGNGMVAPGRRHANLIPSHPFAGRIAASVQHRGNLVVAVANSHTTNDLQRLHAGSQRACHRLIFGVPETSARRLRGDGMKPAP